MAKSLFHRRRSWIGLALALLGAAAVAAALVGLAGSGSKGAVVATKGTPSAAVGQAAIVPVTTTPTTVSVPAVSATVPPSPATTPPTTTRPIGAAATIPPVRPHADPATSIPDTTVATTIPATTVPATTSTTALPTTAAVSIINHYTGAVQVTVNGQTYTLEPQTAVGPVLVTPAASGNDAIAVGSVADPTCGLGDAMKYFYAGKSYELQISAAGGGTCAGGIPGPNFKVSESLASTG